MTTEDVLTRLKQETLLCHQQVESRVTALLDTSEVAVYGQLLKAFLGFYKPVEQALEQIEGYPELGLNLAERKKTHLVRADLQDLGQTIQADEQAVDLPAVSSLSEALGVMYVMEGATLGGQYICRTVGQNLGLTKEYGARFFFSYGEDVRRMWNEFRAAVSAHTTDKSKADVIVSSATETFQKLDAWFAARLP